MFVGRKFYCFSPSLVEHFLHLSVLLLILFRQETLLHNLCVLDLSLHLLHAHLLGIELLHLCIYCLHLYLFIDLAFVVLLAFPPEHHLLLFELNCLIPCILLLFFYLFVSIHMLKDLLMGDGPMIIVPLLQQCQFLSMLRY